MRSFFLRLALVVGLVAIAVNLVSAHLNGPPSGHTGAPGQGTCGDAGCHDAPSNRIGGFVGPSAATLDQDTNHYLLQFIDLATGPSVDDYGFQLTVSDSLRQPFGQLIVTDSMRTQLTADSSGRQYLSHTAAGTPEGSDGTLCSNCITWEFAWVRPLGSVPSDPVWFHFSGVLADADGTPSGDVVVTDSLDRTACLIRVVGDVNASGIVTSADIIRLIGHVFKYPRWPYPCEAAGDIDCDQRINVSDIIRLVNFVFKDGEPPCDVCAMILDTVWDCL